MYQQEYNNALEWIKTNISLINDYNNMLRCEKNIKMYVRNEAYKCLQNMLREYKAQIDFFGMFVDGICVCCNEASNYMSDDSIKNQLIYIGNHIPLYALVREGNEKLAKKICEWMRGI